MTALRGTGVPGCADARRAAAASFALALAFGASATPVGAQPGDAGTRADSEVPPAHVFASIAPDTATVGDRVSLRIRVERDLGVEVTPPDVRAAIAPLEVLGSASLPDVERGGRVVEEDVFAIVAFETGVHAVPSLTFRFADAAGDTGSVRTDSMVVVIRSVLPADEEELAPRDIKPPLELPRRIWPFVLAASIAAGLLVAYRYAAAWWRRRLRPARERPEEPAVPPRAAHLVALERLEALRQDDPIGRREIESFYVRVTDIVRRYIRDRFAVDAIDMTTRELEPAMLYARIRPEEVDRTIEYLSRADLAKFAKLHPDAVRARVDFDEAWDFVERTRFRDGEGEPTVGASRDADRQTAAGDLGAPTGAAAPGEGEEAP